MTHQLHTLHTGIHGIQFSNVSDGFAAALKSNVTLPCVALAFYSYSFQGNTINEIVPDW